MLSVLSIVSLDSELLSQAKKSIQMGWSGICCSDGECNDYILKVGHWYCNFDTCNVVLAVGLFNMPFDIIFSAECRVATCRTRKS